jgi:GNAT superfamily N-acetyltransferase
VDDPRILPAGWEVREASADEAPQVGYLEQRARAGLAEARGGVGWLGEHAPVDDWGSEIARGDVIVAVIDGVVVGFLHLSGPDDRGIARVVQVYVEPEAREVGFGDLLLAAAIEVMRARAARVIEAEALPGDRDTKNLYERAGITARKITVSAPL